jgi:hypothetical protein
MARYIVLYAPDLFLPSHSNIQSMNADSRSMQSSFISGALGFANYESIMARARIRVVSLTEQRVDCALTFATMHLMKKEGEAEGGWSSIKNNTE